jgi:hypothetical protein
VNNKYAAWKLFNKRSAENKEKEDNVELKRRRYKIIHKKNTGHKL